MSESNTVVSHPKRARDIHPLRTHAKLLGDYQKQRLVDASSAITTITNLLHRDMISNDVQLRKQDVEGLILAAQVLGSHVGDIADDIERSGDFMLSKINAL